MSELQHETRITKTGIEYDYYAKPDDFEPVKDYPEGHRFSGSRRCSDWSRQNGRQCLRLAMHGSTKCYMHGGNSAGGISSPTLIHAKYSKYLPNDLLAKYHNMKDDPELLSVREEIKMVEIRVAELFEDLSGFADSAGWIRDLQKAMSKFRNGVNNQDAVRQGEAFREMEGLIATGASRRDVWDELVKLFESKKRLANAERDRIADANALWTAEQAMLFVTRTSAAFKDVLERHIDKSELRQDILKDMAIVIRSIINKNAEEQSEK